MALSPIQALKGWAGTIKNAWNQATTPAQAAPIAPTKPAPTAPVAMGVKAKAPVSPTVTLPNLATKQIEPTTAPAPAVNIPTASNGPASPINPTSTTGTTNPVVQNNTTATNPLTYGGLIQQSIEATKMTPEEQALKQKSASLKGELADKLGKTEMQAIPLEFITGQQQTLQNMAAQKQAAIQEGIQSLQEQRGIASRAYDAAAGRLAPVQVAPSITGVNPLTGEKVYGGDYSAAKEWSNYQFNTSQAQQAGKEASDTQRNTGLVSTKWNNLNNVMNKYKINTDPRLSNAGINMLREMVGDAGYKEFETAYAGLQDTVSTLMSTPGISKTDSTVLNTIMSMLNDKQLTPAALAGVTQQVINIGNQTAEAQGQQALAYDQAGTQTVIGRGNTPNATKTTSSGGTTGDQSIYNW